MPARKVKMTEVNKVARELLIDFKELPGFKNAEITAIRPIYDTGGKKVAYHEVKFSTPGGEDNGYAIISATTADYPVVEFSEEGPTHHERFEHLTRGKDFRMVRFGPQYVTAEDKEGKLLAEIGSRPAVIPGAFKKHLRSEAKGESVLTELPKMPKVDWRKAREKVRRLDYKTYKRTFRKPALKTAEITKAWSHALKPRGNPGCSYDYYWSDGTNNHPHYSQIPANTPPNSTSHWSGCGPTAWMNVYGWHDLNWRSSLLSGSQKYNNSYIENLTMDVHDRLGTTWMFGQGFTWPGDMSKGIGFARSRLHHSCSYWYRYDWWNTDETWVFRVARDVIRAKRPFIVGYFQDWHYTVGYGVAECKTHGWKKHSWIRIYKPTKWIPKSTIFGIWGVYNFYPLLEFVGIENPQELKVGVSGPLGANYMYIYTGTAVFASRGGTGSQWLRGSLSFDVGRSFTSNQYRRVVATASLASIANQDHAVNAGWAIDRVVAGRSSESGKTRLTVNYAVGDIDGYLHRMAYKVTVLSKLGVKQKSGEG